MRASAAYRYKRKYTDIDAQLLELRFILEKNIVREAVNAQRSFLEWKAINCIPTKSIGTAGGLFRFIVSAGRYSNKRALHTRPHLNCVPQYLPIRQQKFSLSSFYASVRGARLKNCEILIN